MLCGYVKQRTEAYDGTYSRERSRTSHIGHALRVYAQWAAALVHIRQNFVGMCITPLFCYGGIFFTVTLHMVCLKHVFYFVCCLDNNTSSHRASFREIFSSPTSFSGLQPFPTLVPILHWVCMYVAYFRNLPHVHRSFH